MCVCTKPLVHFPGISYLVVYLIPQMRHRLKKNQLTLIFAMASLTREVVEKCKAQSFQAMVIIPKQVCLLKTLQDLELLFETTCFCAMVQNQCRFWQCRACKSGHFAQWECCTTSPFSPLKSVLLLDL